MNKVHSNNIYYLGSLGTFFIQWSNVEKFGSLQCA